MFVTHDGQVVFLEGLSTCSDILLIQVEKVLAKAIAIRCIDEAGEDVIINVNFRLGEQYLIDWNTSCSLVFSTVDLLVDDLELLEHVVGASRVIEIGAARRTGGLKTDGPFMVLVGRHI